MTFEQGSASPFDVKVYNQWLASWMSASAAGMQRQRVLADWHNAYVEAAAQGAAGLLQPNQVFNPGNEVEFEVPDITVRNYFMMNEPSKLGEISKVRSASRQANISSEYLSRCTRLRAMSHFRPALLGGL